jgi:NADH dehydrogenase
MQKQYLTFIVVGGGPTGVEMAGALGEISRFTLGKEFRNIDPKRARVILVEGGPKILPGFDPDLAEKATRDLENLGVTIWTNSIVTDIRNDGISIGKERIKANTVLWAAGIGSVPISHSLGVSLDRAGRVIVQGDMSVREYPEIFVAGDQACVLDDNGKPLPGIAPVAIQQGNFIPDNILADLKGKPRKDFHYFDKGIMATIGRERAVVQTHGLKFSGFIAWLAWLFVHIMYLVGFRSRFLVFSQWFWSYVTFRRGTRLITTRSWRTRQQHKLESAAGKTARRPAAKKKAKAKGAAASAKKKSKKSAKKKSSKKS